jgi:hypothetical protein
MTVTGGPANVSFVYALFDSEPAGTFVSGHVFRSAPDLTTAALDPRSGYWHCDIADHDRLTWSEKVYELFGLPAGAPIERDRAVAQYSEQSRSALEQIRNFALNRKFGFILDAAVRSKGASHRWIRVLAVPILFDGRIIGLHGLKRAI